MSDKTNTGNHSLGFYFSLFVENKSMINELVFIKADDKFLHLDKWQRDSIPSTRYLVL